MARDIVIRHPTLGDMKPFLAAVRASQSLHRPWISGPDTAVQFRGYLRRFRPPSNYAFLVCGKEDDALIGVINLSNIVRGHFQSGYLGYYVFAGHQRHGLMKQGLRAVMNHAFKRLKLHRLEANIQRGNTASRALVAACGFSQEGFSPRYLKVGGRWKDHERWAVLAR